MIWRLAKEHDFPEFRPYGHLKGPKIENEVSKNIVLSSLRPWTKIAGAGLIMDDDISSGLSTMAICFDFCSTNH